MNTIDSVSWLRGVDLVKYTQKIINYQTKSEAPSGHFKFKIIGHFSVFHIDLIEFFRRIMPADYYAKSAISSIYLSC
ncbi:MAG: hypothetical protein LWX02_11625 [Deltaproteobacteria bacterium]|jgi:hypothetical protein|nr:hypothetical protein [Deltaproteobacteria bacterium]